MTQTEQAYTRFRDRLAAYVTRRMGHARDTEDIVQDVFLRVARNRDTFARAEKPLAWLYSVTNSVMADAARRRRRAPVLADPPRPIEDFPAPEDMSGSGFERCLDPVIGTLDQKYRDALRLTDLGGARQADLARTEGISLPAAKSRVQRARAQLREAILDCCIVETEAGDVSLTPRGDCC